MSNQSYGMYELLDFPCSVPVNYFQAFNYHLIKAILRKMTDMGIYR